MAQGFVAANQNQLGRSYNLYQKSVQYWTALHGKDAEKLTGLKADLAKIKARVAKAQKEGKGGEVEAKDELDHHEPIEVEQDSASSSSASSSSAPASAPAAAPAARLAVSSPPAAASAKSAAS